MLILALTFTLTFILFPWAAVTAGIRSSDVHARLGVRQDVPCVNHSNGCSVPKLFSLFLRRTTVSVLTPACDRHDMCYSCGYQHGVDRKQCDILFHQDMLQACNALNTEHSRFLQRMRLKFRRQWCRMYADAFYVAVDRFGSYHYHSHGPAPSYCSHVHHCFLSSPEKQTVREPETVRRTLAHRHVEGLPHPQRHGQRLLETILTGLASAEIPKLR